MESMNDKISKQEKYINLLEANQKDTQNKHVIETQKTLRDYEHLL